jgi:hypothetical protein
MVYEGKKGPTMHRANCEVVTKSKKGLLHGVLAPVKTFWHLQTDYGLRLRFCAHPTCFPKKFTRILYQTVFLIVRLSSHVSVMATIGRPFLPEWFGPLVPYIRFELPEVLAWNASTAKLKYIR